MIYLECVGYILVGMIVARITALLIFRNDPSEDRLDVGLTAVVFGFLWPAAAILLAFIGVIFLLGQLATLPTWNPRRWRRRVTDDSEQAIHKLAELYDLPYPKD